MKVIVFGATGKTGLEIVKQGLEQGHEVTAFVRDPRKLDAAELDLQDKNLHVAIGDVFDSATIEAALPDHDAVLVSLGTRSLGRTTVRSEGTKNIMDAMKKQGIRRILVVTALGVHESWGQLDWAAKAFFVTLLRNVKVDHEAQEDLVRHSGLDWTIVRPGGLTDKEMTASYTHGTETSIRAGRIARADVADFMLEQLSSDAYLQKAVAVT